VTRTLPIIFIYFDNVYVISKTEKEILPHIKELTNARKTLRIYRSEKQNQCQNQSHKTGLLGKIYKRYESRPIWSTEESLEDAQEQEKAN